MICIPKNCLSLRGNPFLESTSERKQSVSTSQVPQLLILSEKLTGCSRGEYKGSMDCGCYCPVLAKLICIYWGTSKQGQERRSNPVNHLHSAVYNGASVLLILISAGGTNIESDLFTHMARDYRSFIRYEKNIPFISVFKNGSRQGLCTCLFNL